MKYADKLLDPRWQKKRLEVFNRDGFKCLCCSDDKETLQVHHLIYVKGQEPWDAPMENLETLCRSCHEWREEFNEFAGGRTLMPTIICYAFCRFSGIYMNTLKPNPLRLPIVSFNHYLCYVATAHVPEKWRPSDTVK